MILIPICFSDLEEKQAAAQKLAEDKERAEKERLELEDQRRQAEEEARKLQEVCAMDQFFY